MASHSTAAARRATWALISVVSLPIGWMCGWVRHLLPRRRQVYAAMLGLFEQG